MDDNIVQLKARHLLKEKSFLEYYDNVNISIDQKWEKKKGHVAVNSLPINDG